MQDPPPPEDAFALPPSKAERRSLPQNNRGRLPVPDSPVSYTHLDCAEYLTIDLCCRSYTALVGHEDLIYLTQPELIGVYRHDKKEKDDLLDVLYHYCLNNCNISQTARAVYMHRNTVAAKVEKLKALVHADLTNGNIQQRMVFSYRVLRYAEVFSGRKPEELLLENSVDG